MLWTPPTTLANLATGLPVPVRCPYFDFCFGFLWDLNDWLPSGELLVLRRRVVAALDEESSVVSCGNDVGDVRAVELEELVDNPGTTIGTKFAVLHWICLPFFDKVWFFLVHSYAESFPAIRPQAYP